MSDTIVKRPYRSPLRAAQAEATRQRILDAGLELFAERGYPATSVTQIAAAAGVSPETIYASVGSKRGIIDALLAQIDTEAVEERVVALVTERGGTPEAALGVAAELSATFWARHGTLVARPAQRAGGPGDRRGLGRPSGGPARTAAPADGTLAGGRIP